MPSFLSNLITGTNLLLFFSNLATAKWKFVSLKAGQKKICFVQFIKCYVEIQLASNKDEFLLKFNCLQFFKAYGLTWTMI